MNWVAAVESRDARITALEAERDQAITERDQAKGENIALAWERDDLRRALEEFARVCTERDAYRAAWESAEDALDEAREALRPFAEETAFHLKHDDSCCSVDGEALERARAVVATSPPKRPSTCPACGSDDQTKRFVRNLTGLRCTDTWHGLPSPGRLVTADGSPHDCGPYCEHPGPNGVHPENQEPRP